MAPSADGDEQPLPAPEAAPAMPGNAEDPAFTEEEGWAAQPSSETEPSVVPEPMPQTEEPAPSTLEPPQAQERVQQAPPLDASERAHRVSARHGLFRWGASTPRRPGMHRDRSWPSPRQALLGILPNAASGSERSGCSRRGCVPTRASRSRPCCWPAAGSWRAGRSAAHAERTAARAAERAVPAAAAVMARVGRHREPPICTFGAAHRAQQSGVGDGRGMARAEGERAEALAAFQRRCRV